MGAGLSSGRSLIGGVTVARGRSSGPRLGSGRAVGNFAGAASPRSASANMVTEVAGDSSGRGDTLKAGGAAAVSLGSPLGSTGGLPVLASSVGW